MKNLLTLLCLTASSAVFCAEIYVSPKGNDANAGTADSPLKSVQKAVNKAKAGDTVKLLPGIFRENVTVSNKAGTAEKPITICGSRDKSGNYLAILEPVGKELKNWTPAPEIGKDVWKIPLAKRPDLVTMDGRMIAQINKFNMVLPRRKPLPEKITQDMIWKDYLPKTSKRLSGLDLLAVKADIMVSHSYFRDREEALFPVIGYVLCGWYKGNLYLRYANGSEPAKHTITASYGNGITIKNSKYVTLRDLYMRGSTVQIFITDKSSNTVVENNLLMHGSARVKVARGVSDTTVRGNILTCGFIQDEHFKLRSGNDMRGGLLYLIFKYVIGVATSDDVGIIFIGKNTHVYDNVIFDGLLGIEAGGPGAKVYNNSIRNMSSCGIITGYISSGEFFNNLVMNSGIPLRIHDWRHEKFYRTEYHYNNLFVQAPHAGSYVHIYGAPDKVNGPDKVNYDKNGIYKENPPAPFDPGKVFVYHNTFVGGNNAATIIPVRAYYRKYREQPMPFYIMNNIIKSSWSWGMKFQHALAGNLLYVAKKDLRQANLTDKTVADFNRVSPFEKLDSIWVDGSIKPDKLPDARLKADSVAAECAVDVSKDFVFRGYKVQALPGFKPGYYKGKAPAAGAIQMGDDEKMQHFNMLYERFEKARKYLPAR